MVGLIYNLDNDYAMTWDFNLYCHGCCFIGFTEAHAEEGLAPLKERREVERELGEEKKRERSDGGGKGKNMKEKKEREREEERDI